MSRGATGCSSHVMPYSRHVETVRRCLSMKSVSISKPDVAETAHAVFGAKSSYRVVDRTVAMAATVAISCLKRRLA